MTMPKAHCADGWLMGRHLTLGKTGLADSSRHRSPRAATPHHASWRCRFESGSANQQWEATERKEKATPPDIRENLTRQPGDVALRQGVVRNGLLTIAHRNSQHERRGFESRLPRRSFSRRDMAVAKKQHHHYSLNQSRCKRTASGESPAIFFFLRQDAEYGWRCLLIFPHSQLRATGDGNAALSPQNLR